MNVRIHTTAYRQQQPVLETVHMEALPEDIHKECNIVNLYPAYPAQTIEGFGGALTESVGYTLSQLPKETAQCVLNDCFGVDGLHYTLARTHLDSCDFCLSEYEAMSDPSDHALKSFSIRRDEQYVLPLLESAKQAAGGTLPVMLTPWSPPAFMKDNGERCHGGRLKAEHYDLWAAYICRYIQTYRARGIEVDRISIQNEPNAVQRWDSCLFTAEEERTFLENALYPKLCSEGLSGIKVYIWDHNKERLVERVNSVACGKARHMVHGAAFHWYSGDHFDALRLVRERFPAMELLFSEGCIEYSRFSRDNQLENAQIYAHDIIGNFNAGMNTFLDWNIVLDQQGGPNHAGNDCEAPILCDVAAGTYERKLSYYYIRHFSRYIAPGARLVPTSKYAETVDVAAFLNPDGRIIAVLLNRENELQRLTLRCSGIQIPLTLPERGICTVEIL